jgi:hypothetical protein
MPGSMLGLQNLVPSPSTPNAFVPRPAAIKLTGFNPFAIPGVVSALQVIGTRAYGMIASARFAGRDEPFCYDLLAQTFVTISGVTAANTPLTPSPLGDWTPPVLTEPTNSRIIVTHPGYTGAGGVYFGWLDMSSFSATTLKGNVTHGSNVITSINDGFSSAPIADGVQPGQLITAGGLFPAGTSVVSATNGLFSLNTTGNTHSNTTLDGLASVSGVLPGMTVTGSGIQAGTTVVSVSGSTVVLSLAASSTVTALAVNFSGGGTITVSSAATGASTNNQALNITGGSQSAPLWGGGNLNTNPLPQVPVCAGSFNGRAFYGFSNYAVFSDILNPTQVTYASQALQLGDSTAITAFAGLPFVNTVTGGALQALIVFKGAGSMYQITGDAALSNLSQNYIDGSVGTNAPNTITNTPEGLYYIAPDGMRMLALSGQPSQPLGAQGSGVNVPFLNAVSPSRMCADFSQNTFRVTVQNGQAPGQPFQEYFYDFRLRVWTGPHTFPSALIAAFGDANSFITAPAGIKASLWQSDVTPSDSSSYLENGAMMNWAYTTTLMPDNDQMFENAVTETALALAIAPSDTLRIVAYNELGIARGTVYVTGVTPPVTLWGQFCWGANNWYGGPADESEWGVSIWDQFNWGAQQGALVQYEIPWNDVLVFKQMFVTVTGASAPGQTIGNLYLRYQQLGYLLQGPGT